MIKFQIEHCSKFFFLPISEIERLRDIHDALNADDELSGPGFESPAAISKGMILAAPLDDKYRRAKVLKVMANVRPLQFKVISNDNECQLKFYFISFYLIFCQVFFIDNGSVGTIGFDELRPFSKKLASLCEIPPRVFECRLAMVQPSSVRSPNGKWSEDANELLKKCADAGIVELDIFSVVEVVANVIIKIDHNTLNDLLVEKHLARKCEETYLSKVSVIFIPFFFLFF